MNSKLFTQQISLMADTKSKERLTALVNHFAAAIADPEEHIKYVMSDSVDKWYVKLHSIHGDQGEFIGGEYLVEIRAPEDFPFAPPKFTFLTPNGVYDTNKPVCISIGEYHKENYRATLQMAGFVRQLVSGIIGWQQLGQGISIIKTTVAQKKMFAKNSTNYNLTHYADIDALVETNWAAYKLLWKKPIAAPSADVVDDILADLDDLSL